MIRRVHIVGTPAMPVVEVHMSGVRRNVNSIVQWSKTTQLTRKYTAPRSWCQYTHSRWYIDLFFNIDKWYEAKFNLLFNNV